MKLTRENLNNKLIDSHTHAGMSLSNFFDDKFPYCYSTIEIGNAIKLAGFDAACVFPFPAYACGSNLKTSQENRELLRNIFEAVPYKSAIEKLLLELDRFKLDNLLPFGMFSVNYAIGEQIDFLESVSDKIYGLKYYPDADAKKLALLKDEGKDFIEFLIKHNMPLTIHVSENACLRNEGFSNALDAIELARSNPQLRVAVAHMGHFSKAVWDLALELKLPNLYFDVSPLLHICHIRTINSGSTLNLDYHKPQSVLEALIELLPNNILWGSDIPFNFTCNLNNDNHCFDYEEFSLEKNIEALQKLSKENIYRICNENTLNFLFGSKE